MWGKRLRQGRAPALYPYKTEMSFDASATASNNTKRKAAR